MYNTNDELLVTLKPKSLSMDEYVGDIEAVIDESGYHSDEISETDNEKTQEEIDEQIRPKNKKESDKHILRVYDKPCRSTRVREMYLLNIFNFFNLHTLYISLLYIL